MHSSGIEVNPELRDQFKEIVDANDNIAFVKISIENDAFKIMEHILSKGTEEEDWLQIQADLKPKTPMYYVKRDSQTHKWALVYFVPDNAKVREKMVFSSSCGALRNLTNFELEYPISEARECTLNAFELFVRGVDEEVVMTGEELIKKEAAYQDNFQMSETRVSAIVGVPIQVADTVEPALLALKEGGGAVNTVVLQLDGATEILSVEESGTHDIASIKSTYLSNNEPRYILHNYAHTQGGESATKILFIYYCPSNAKPKLKMFYSTCKTSIAKILENVGFSGYHNLECDQSDEVTDNSVYAELYPKAEVKAIVKKPSARGRGTRTVKKFQA